MLIRLETKYVDPKPLCVTSRKVLGRKKLTTTKKYFCHNLIRYVWENSNKYASCPDWHISPHADRRHRQGWPVCHTGLATARPVCRTWLTAVQCIIDFSLFGLGTNPWAKVHQKGRWTPRSTTLQNFIALRQPTPEISVTKILRINKQKNNYASCPDWRISPHVNRRHRQ